MPRGVAKVTAYVLDRDQASACRIPGELALPLGPGDEENFGTGVKSLSDVSNTRS